MSSAENQASELPALLTIKQAKNHNVNKIIAYITITGSDEMYHAQKCIVLKTFKSLLNLISL